MSAASGTLEDEPEPTFAAPAITVVLASEGYPRRRDRPTDRGLDAAASTPGVHLAHAATAGRTRPAATSSRRADACSTSSRRARASQARERAYAALGEITLEGSHYRRDIAARVAE
jgi:phosphoribosylamine--glycine ligase